MNFLTLKPEAFGLDISDLSLKIVKLKKKGKFLDLACFSETAVKPGVIHQGEIKDEKALAKTIQKAVSQVKGEKLTTKYLVASLPEEKAFLQVIKMPIMKEEEIKKAVYFEAENYIPLSIDKVYLDSQVVPQIHSEPKHSDVLIAALPKQTVDPYVSSLRQAGLKPLALEIESQAISRALIEKGVCPEPLLLVDLGMTGTSFIIFSGCSLRFTSSYSAVSSQKFTEVIAQSLKVDLKKAEALKVEKGIAAAGDSKKILQALSPDLTNLVEQIKKYLDYCHDYYKKEIQKVLLCGGGANLKGLTNFLSARVNLPVVLANPWINILPQPPKEIAGLPYQESLRYATALGLALRGIK